MKTNGRDITMGKERGKYRERISKNDTNTIGQGHQEKLATLTTHSDVCGSCDTLENAITNVQCRGVTQRKLSLSLLQSVEAELT